MKKRLKEIAYACSGDKGENANIGVIAYKEEDYITLKNLLTEERVADHFAELKPQSIIRYELPNLWALNFILVGVLDGGLRGLRIDAQGKVLGQALLEIEL